MDNNNMIQNFGDMVAATEKMSKPWQEALEKNSKRWFLATIISNLFWMIIVGMLVFLAYMPTGTTTYNVDQGQDGQTQNQTVQYESTTNGN